MCLSSTLIDSLAYAKDPEAGSSFLSGRVFRGVFSGCFFRLAFTAFFSDSLFRLAVFGLIINKLDLSSTYLSINQLINKF